MDPIKLLAVLAVVANIMTLFLLLNIILPKYVNRIKVWKDTDMLLEKKALFLSFIIGLTATLGSLYLSESRMFTPCKLCWFQRIFMYPMPIILGVALFKKARDVAMYVIPLAVTGGLIAIYHYYLQINPEPFAPCTTVGFSVSCSETFFAYFGFITIPWMSFSAFILIFVLSYHYLQKNR